MKDVVDDVANAVATNYCCYLIMSYYCSRICCVAAVFVDGVVAVVVVLKILLITHLQLPMVKHC